MCVSKFETQTPRENASQQKSIMCFLFLLFIGIVLTETQDYRHFLSSVIGVNRFHSLNCCYFICYYCFYCCYCSCFALCFPFSFLFVSASYTYQQITPQLSCYKPLTLQNYSLLNCTTVCSSAVTNHWPSN